MHRKDFAGHERSDEERTIAVVKELATVGTKLDGISKQVANIEGRQWDETSKTQHVTPLSSNKHVSRPIDNKMVVALTGAIVILVQLLGKVIEHQVLK